MPSANETLSLSEKFFGRRQWDGLPALPVMPLLVPPTEATSSLPPLQVGDQVRIQHPLSKKWDEKGIVEAVRDTGLSYVIKRSDGRSFIRGRRLVKLDKSDPDSDSDIEVHDDLDEPIPQIPDPNPLPPPSPTPASPRRSRRKRRRPARFN